MAIDFIHVTEDRTRIHFAEGGWERLNDAFLWVKEPGERAVRSVTTAGDMTRIDGLVEDFEAARPLDADVTAIRVEGDETKVRFDDGTVVKFEDGMLKIRYGDDGARLFRPVADEDETWLDDLIEANEDLVKDDSDDDDDADDDGVDDDDDGAPVDDDGVGSDDDDDDDGAGPDHPVHETLTGDDEDNTISGRQGRDDIDGGDGDDTLSGGQGRDTVKGGEGDDDISGDQGRDDLDGGDGDDTIDGGRGRDVITDGAGMDTLTGGKAVDTFVFVVDGEADEITDFELHKDVLDLTAFGLTPATLPTLSDTADGLEMDLGGGDTILFSNLTMADVGGIGDFDL